MLSPEEGAYSLLYFKRRMSPGVLNKPPMTNESIQILSNITYRIWGYDGVLLESSESIRRNCQRWAYSRYNPSHRMRRIPRRGESNLIVVQSGFSRRESHNSLRQSLSMDPYRITLSTSQSSDSSNIGPNPIQHHEMSKGRWRNISTKQIAESPDSFMEVMIQAFQHRKFQEETDATMTWFTLLPESCCFTASQRVSV